MEFFLQFPGYAFMEQQGTPSEKNPKNLFFSFGIFEAIVVSLQSLFEKSLEKSKINLVFRGLSLENQLL